MVMRRYEKVDASDNRLKSKTYDDAKVSFGTKDGIRWLPVEQLSQPSFNAKTQRLERTRSVQPTKVQYGWRVVDLTAEEQRERVDPLNDIVEVLIKKVPGITRADFKSILGRT